MEKRGAGGTVALREVELLIRPWDSLHTKHGQAGDDYSATFGRRLGKAIKIQ